MMQDEFRLSEQKKSKSKNKNKKIKRHPFFINYQRGSTLFVNI